jgi:hypothetical protein
MKHLPRSSSKLVRVYWKPKKHAPAVGRAMTSYSETSNTKKNQTLLGRTFQTMWHRVPGQQHFHGFLTLACFQDHQQVHKFDWTFNYSTPCCTQSPGLVWQRLL